MKLTPASLRKLRVQPAIFLIVVTAAFGLLSTKAFGQIFLTNTNAGTIGEYDVTTGAPINSTLVSGLNHPTQVAVSGTDLFVRQGNGTIGAYTTSGAAINSSLISSVGIFAIGQGNIYTIHGLANLSTAIGVFDLNTGAVVNPALVTWSNGEDVPNNFTFSGIQLYAVNDNFNNITAYSTSGTLDYTAGIVGNLAFVPEAIVSSGPNLFETNFIFGSTDTVGEYNATTGAVINSSLITLPNHSGGIALSGSDLFIPNSGGTTISEYTTSGTLVNASLISGLTSLGGIAVSGANISIPEPSTWSLLAGGVVALFAFCRRRKRSAVSLPAPAP